MKLSDMPTYKYRIKATVVAEGYFDIEALDDKTIEMFIERTTPAMKKEMYVVLKNNISSIMNDCENVSVVDAKMEVVERHKKKSP